MRKALLLIMIPFLATSLLSLASWSSVQSQAQYSFLDYNGNLFASLIYKAVVLNPYSIVNYNFTVKYLFYNSPSYQTLVYTVTISNDVIKLATGNLTVVAVTVSTPYGTFPLQEALTNGTLVFFGFAPNVSYINIYVANGSQLLTFVQKPSNGTFSTAYFGLVPKEIAFESYQTYAPAENYTFTISNETTFSYFGSKFTVESNVSYSFFRSLPSVFYSSSGKATLLGNYVLVTTTNNVLTVTYYPTFHYSFYGFKAFGTNGVVLEGFVLGMQNSTIGFTLLGYGNLSSYTFFLNETLNQSGSLLPFQYGSYFDGLPIAYNLTGQVASVVPVKLLITSKEGLVVLVKGEPAFLNSSGVFPVNNVSSYEAVNLTLGGVEFEALEVNLPAGINLVTVPQLAGGNVVVLNSNSTQANNVLYLSAGGGKVIALIAGSGTYYFLFESTGHTLTTTTSTTTKSTITTTTTTTSIPSSTVPQVTTSSTTLLQTFTSSSILPQSTSGQQVSTPNVVLVITIVALAVLIVVAAVILLRK